MKKIFLCLILLIASVGWAQAISLRWDGSPTKEQVTEFRIYRLHQGIATQIGTVPASQGWFIVDAYMIGTRTNFYVTAVNINGESLKSDIVTVQEH